jgi:glutathione S-transferase
VLLWLSAVLHHQPLPFRHPLLLNTHPGSQADPAKATFWETHCDPSTANGRNGGAHLAYFEELLKAGSSGWMVGAGLTAADLCVFDMVVLLLRIYPDQLPSAVSQGTE